MALTAEHETQETALLEVHKGCPGKSQPRQSNENGDLAGYFPDSSPKLVSALKRRANEEGEAETANHGGSCAARAKPEGLTLHGKQEGGGAETQGCRGRGAGSRAGPDAGSWAGPGARSRGCRGPGARHCHFPS